MSDRAGLRRTQMPLRTRSGLLHCANRSGSARRATLGLTCAMRVLRTRLWISGRPLCGSPKPSHGVISDYKTTRA